MFSIIVPVYNLEKCIERCLKSLLEQDYVEYEIIIVNDGSTDKSEKLCENYVKRDNRVHLITTTNNGLSVARNTGVSNAKGRYIIFIDGDDFVENGFLRELAENIDSNNYPDLLMFGYRQLADITLEKIGTNENVEIHRGAGSDFLEKVLAKKRVYSWYVWRYAYKREFYCNNQFTFTPGIHYEDIDFMFKVILQAKSMITIPKVYYNYIVGRKSSITGQYNIKSEMDKQKVIADNVAYIKEHTNGNLQALLLKNMFTLYSSSLHVLYFYKNEEFQKLLNKLKKIVIYVNMQKVGRIDYLLFQ